MAFRPRAPIPCRQYLAYNSSKTALNAIALSLAKDLAEDGIKVNAADPGYTKTDFNNHSRTVEQAADTIVWLAGQDASGPTGGFFFERSQAPWCVRRALLAVVLSCQIKLAAALLCGSSQSSRQIARFRMELTCGAFERTQSELLHTCALFSKLGMAGMAKPDRGAGELRHIQRSWCRLSGNRDARRGGT
ncbi:SDR family NAD(P)-dependent oxidoreductase [Rhizobium sp. Leaf371]|uniref:SDR family NAD(P)-dependent oxidoreductase n=1 Tax=Rhizobium sp. Leaf371 TaxID=1736355 RepID=UPI001FCDA7A4|nr:SDR family NAD(P)-dependent oxidoreductase [Rhizobium sp. Leaf371]